MSFIIGAAMWIAVFVGVFIFIWVGVDLETALICYGGAIVLTAFLMVGYYLMYGTLAVE